MDRSRGSLLRQPDKRGAAAGAAANKKGINRMDSMGGYGVRLRPSPLLFAEPGVSRRGPVLALVLLSYHRTF